MMNIQVLLSCMFSDKSIIQRTNIQGDVVVVNQCDDNSIEEFGFTNKNGQSCKALFINTTERGLSKSRNMAIANAWGDVCVICDDDEVMYDDYVEIIRKEYDRLPSYDIIVLEVDRERIRNLPEQNLNRLNALRVSSITITFRLDSIRNNQVSFDETVGSGVSKAGGEENLFLYSCLNKKLSGRIIPRIFARMIEGDGSKWFHGYSKEYFFDRGGLTYKLMGGCLASVYAIYYLLFKYSLYKKDISLWNAGVYLLKGLSNTWKHRKDLNNKVI